MADKEQGGEKISGNDTAALWAQQRAAMAP